MPNETPETMEPSESQMLEQDSQINQDDISAQFGRMIFSNMQLSKQIEALQKQNARLAAKIK